MAKRITWIGFLATNPRAFGIRNVPSAICLVTPFGVLCFLKGAR